MSLSKPDPLPQRMITKRFMFKEQLNIIKIRQKEVLEKYKKVQEQMLADYQELQTQIDSLGQMVTTSSDEELQQNTDLNSDKAQNDTSTPTEEQQQQLTPAQLELDTIGKETMWDFCSVHCTEALKVRQTYISHNQEITKRTHVYIFTIYQCHEKVIACLCITDVT